MSLALITFGKIEGFFGRGISKKNFSRCSTCSNRVAGAIKLNRVDSAVQRIFRNVQGVCIIQKIAAESVCIQVVNRMGFHQVQQLGKLIPVGRDGALAICLQLQRFDKVLKRRLIDGMNVSNHIFSR